MIWISFFPLFSFFFFTGGPLKVERFFFCFYLIFFLKLGIEFPLRKDGTPSTVEKKKSNFRCCPEKKTTTRTIFFCPKRKDRKRSFQTLGNMFQFSTEFYRVLPSFQRSSERRCKRRQEFTEFYRVLPSFTEFP